MAFGWCHAALGVVFSRAMLWSALYALSLALAGLSRVSSCTMLCSAHLCAMVLSCAMLCSAVSQFFPRPTGLSRKVCERRASQQSALHARIPLYTARHAVRCVLLYYIICEALCYIILRCIIPRRVSLLFDGSARLIALLGIAYRICMQCCIGSALHTMLRRAMRWYHVCI
jgi:hypothetical protein